MFNEVFRYILHSLVLLNITPCYKHHDVNGSMEVGITITRFKVLTLSVKKINAIIE